VNIHEILSFGQKKIRLWIDRGTPIVFRASYLLITYHSLELIVQFTGCR
jgi:hypothetical protein